MEHGEYVDALRRDTDGLLDSARRAGADAAVPPCPGWDVDDLVWHIGEVQAFWGAIVTGRLQDPATYEPPDRPPTFDATLELAEQSRDRLVDALASTDPATEVWTWADQHDVAWIGRRMAHEAAVHRWDAEAAAGRADAIEPSLASDGIDEFLEHHLVVGSDGRPPLDGSVHLHCTDVAGEWLVQVDDVSGEPVVTREHAKGSAAIRGPASDLLLVLWRRRPLADADVVGDRAVAERFVAGSPLE